MSSVFALRTSTSVQVPVIVYQGFVAAQQSAEWCHSKHHRITDKVGVRDYDLYVAAHSVDTVIENLLLLLVMQ